MNVHWTETAVNHLSHIENYISTDSPTYARRVIDHIIRRSEDIAQFPQSGRAVPEYQSDEIREIIEGNYRIIYKIKENQIDILSVLHGAQKLPPKSEMEN